MPFDIKEVDSTKRQITVTVDASELSEIEAGIVEQIRKTASIPGFRKGKAPVGLVKKSYAGMIRSDMIETAISRNYKKIFDEADLKPVAQGNITKVDFVDIPSGLQFEVELEVEPDVEIKQFKGLTVEKEIVNVSEKMVEESLQNLRKQYATVKESEIVEAGHLVKIDVQELGEGGMPIIGRKYEDVETEVGSGQFDKDIEEQLIGLKVDEEAVVNTAQPPAAPDQPPQMVSFKVRVKSIQEHELPPLDDELVKNLDDDNLETLDQLRQRIEENLQTRLNQQSRSQFQSRMVDELLKLNPFDVPEAMIQNYLDYQIEDIKRRYPKSPVNEDALRKEMRVEAIHGIRWHLLKQKLVDVENIEVTEAEINARIDTTHYSDAEKDYMKKDSYFANRIKEELLDEKVFALLEKHAKVTEVYPNPEADDADAGVAPSDDEITDAEIVEEK